MLVKNGIVVTIDSDIRSPFKYKAISKAIMMIRGVDRVKIVRCQKKTRITPKPLRVLSELANSDMTIGEVAEKLHICRNTANHHLDECKKRLGVKTTIGAIKAALQQGLIELK